MSIEPIRSILFFHVGSNLSHLLIRTLKHLKLFYLEYTFYAIFMSFAMLVLARVTLSSLIVMQLVPLSSDAIDSFHSVPIARLINLSISALSFSPFSPIAIRSARICMYMYFVIRTIYISYTSTA